MGFGFAEAGGMKGADIVTFEAGSNLLTDRYALKNAAPVEDSCQDWTLISSKSESGTMYVEMKRALSNKDTQVKHIGATDIHSNSFECRVVKSAKHSA